LFSPADIRRARDSSIDNIETLISAVTARLFELRQHRAFPNPETAPEREALNCIRVLTRVLPFIYEVDTLQQWEDKLFWTARTKPKVTTQRGDVLFDERDRDSPEVGETFDACKPLAEELIDTLIELLFFSNFTLPRDPSNRSKVTYAIWQSGVGCNTSVASTKEYENNRCEVLRLLLTLASKSMYTSPSKLPVVGSRAITYIATCSDKQIVLSVLCSLLNTVSPQSQSLSLSTPTANHCRR
jgi:hypothetical protein